MEITKLFEIIAGYLNFAIDLAVLRGVDKYKRLGSIDPQLVSYFVAGVVMAYVIASMQQLPGYESKIPRGKSSEPSAGSGGDGTVLKAKDERDTSAEQKDMASFVLLSILGAFVFHAVLIIYHAVRPSVAIGNVKDTLNAVFAVNAVYHPANALLKQIQRAGNMIAGAGISRTVTLLGGVLLMTVAVGQFATMYYWVYALAAVHDTTRMYMLGPFGVMAVIGVGLAVWVLRPPSARPASVNSVQADAGAIAQRADPFAREVSGVRGERDLSNRENELSV